MVVVDDGCELKGLRMNDGFSYALHEEGREAEQQFKLWVRNDGEEIELFW